MTACARGEILPPRPSWGGKRYGNFRHGSYECGRVTKPSISASV